MPGAQDEKGVCEQIGEAFIGCIKVRRTATFENNLFIDASLCVGNLALSYHDLQFRVWNPRIYMVSA